MLCIDQRSDSRESSSDPDSSRGKGVAGRPEKHVTKNQVNVSAK